MRTPPQEARSRNELHNHLKNHPFLATLMQIGEPHDNPYADDQVNRQIALLMHLFECRGAEDYAAFLAFRKCVIESKATLLTLPILLDLTALEIQLRLRRSENSYPQTGLLVPFFAPVKLRNQSEMARANNQHKQLIYDSPSLELYASHSTNENAETINETVGCDSKVALTTEQQRRRFQRRLNGAQRAYYACEAAVVAGIHTALPSEINMFLQHAAPYLLSGEMSKIQPDTACNLLILFLALIGVSNPANIILVNKLTKIDVELEKGGSYLVYEFRSDSGFVRASLQLPANLLKTAEPKTHDPRVHYIAGESLSIVLPYPATFLLNTLLRGIPSNRRHLNTLSELCHITDSKYTHWLNEILRCSGLHIKGITKRAIEKSFQQYARESVPETYFRFLSGQLCVQNHYVSVSIFTLSQTITSAWREFCVEAGLHWRNANIYEAGELAVSHRHYTEIGSKITLRQEVLNAIFHGLINGLIGSAKDCINLTAFYLYIRVASTVGLRPTKMPFPTIENMNWEFGCFTVADKSVRSKNELRLIILPRRLVELITLWRRCAETFSMSNNAPVPTHLLMHWDEKWVHFDRAVVNGKLARLTNESIINHSFRHTAAQRYLQSSPDFKQSLLDMLLNHSRAGVSVFNRFAQSSPAQLILLQQQLLDSVEHEYAEFDEAIHKSLTQLAGGKNAVI
ncbi:hypothetical protein GCM10008111_08070 [Alishewanella tabrizica]|uniref:Tyr recombinase domain-containing protein n=2 Tax=Alishewanella tabrizica TaxID=671278 RepID=A0ABQ2WJB9_9ALTE|nr:hypothetical protein GCM10008111_08070 [Alishewanella tabrizica]